MCHRYVMRPGSGQDDQELIEFYTRGYREADRLARANNRLEFLRTQQLVRQRLPPAPARVLDVGGGTGVHAAWLAADGHEVELIDVVDEHVRAAREMAAGLPRSFDSRVGDARSLDVADGSVDVCLLLGPLYHLPDRDDRVNVLAEAFRVTRPGGLVFAAAISRYAWPLYELRDGGVISPSRSAAIAAVLGNGVGDPVGSLPGAFSHRPSDLVDELRSAGATDVELFGIEGPGWMLFAPDLPEDRAESLLGTAMSAAALFDGHPDMAASSTHLLAVAARS